MPAVPSFEMFAADGHSGYAFVTFSRSTVVETQGADAVVRWFGDLRTRLRAHPRWRGLGV